MAIISLSSNFTNRSSLAYKFRSVRFKWFKNLMLNRSSNITILDVGGTANYWNTLYPNKPSNTNISLLNIYLHQKNSNGYICLQGSGTDMPQFSDKLFDIVFSNSVIEHVGSFEDQKRMANEVKRIGKSYWIQTPNRYFPVEPHFYFPLFNFLPRFIQIFLLMNFTLGHMHKAKEKQDAIDMINSIRLLSEKELRALFPGATIKKEKFLGLTKSLIAYKA